MGIKRIRRSIREGRYEFTVHALEEMDDDDLDESDVRYAILPGEISSELTDDPRRNKVCRAWRYAGRSAFDGSRLSFSAVGIVAYNYGVSDRGIIMEKDFCEYCNAILSDVEKLVTVYRHRRGKHFIFERVSARGLHKMRRAIFFGKIRSGNAARNEPNHTVRTFSFPCLLSNCNTLE